MFHVEQAIGLLLPDSDKAHIVQRFNFIKEAYFKWNKTINLSSVRDEQGFWEKHILDSLCLAGFIKNSGFTGFDILDIGSGGGFPGLVLASTLNNEITLVDPIKKKTDFLNHVILRLGLKQAKVQTGLFEDIKDLKNKTLIVSRALGNYKELYAHFKAIDNDVSVVVMATEKQDLGVKGVAFNKEYDLINPLIGNSLRGHTLIKLN
jgi:16S rRNA (guanine(527)-N(7))-methyltransferase RsmG